MRRKTRGQQVQVHQLHQMFTNLLSLGATHHPSPAKKEREEVRNCLNHVDDSVCYSAVPSARLCPTGWALRGLGPPAGWAACAGRASLQFKEKPVLGPPRRPQPTPPSSAQGPAVGQQQHKPLG